MSGFKVHPQVNSTIAVLLLNYVSHNPTQHTIPAGVCLEALQGHCQLHACHQPGAIQEEMVPPPLVLPVLLKMKPARSANQETTLWWLSGKGEVGTRAGSPSVEERWPQGGMDSGASARDGEGEFFKPLKAVSPIAAQAMSIWLLRQKKRVYFCTNSFTECLLGCGVTLPGLYWLICSTNNTIILGFFVVFSQVRKQGGSKRIWAVI